MIDVPGLWSAETCAKFLDCSVRHFSERIRHVQGFPQPVRLPTIMGGMRPRWKSAEVIAWVDSFSQAA
jgi:predicted DNA-binding transcriptional regulator AlpA